MFLDKLSSFTLLSALNLNGFLYSSAIWIHRACRVFSVIRTLKEDIQLVGIFGFHIWPLYDMLLLFKFKTLENILQVMSFSQTHFPTKKSRMECFGKFKGR